VTKEFFSLFHLVDEEEGEDVEEEEDEEN